MFEAWHIQIALLATLVFVSWRVIRKYPRVKAYIPYLLWATEIIQEAVNYWKFKRAYKNTSHLLNRYAIILDIIAYQDPNVTKEWFSKFVFDTLKEYVDPREADSARRIVNAIYVLLTEHKDLIDTLKVISTNPQNLDVKKATLIAIDFLGELVNLESRMDRLFYQSMIFGLNKVLLQIKNGRADKKTISAISSTLWRMYQLLLAYKEQNSLQGLTEEEFKKKLQKVLSDLLSSFYNE